MAITYTWSVTGLKANQDGGVVQTYWLKEGRDENGNVGTFSGATPFEVDADAEGYVAFDDLTEETVLGWIKAVVVDDYEAHVNGQIEKQINDSVISEVSLPWAPVDADPATAVAE
jgi:hypothetical protein